MLKFGREVDDRGMGKTKQKNVFYVGFFLIFLTFFGLRPIRFVELIEINY